MRNFIGSAESRRVHSALRVPNSALPCLVLLAWASLLTATARAQDEPEVLVHLERPKIYQGESVEYRVTIRNVKDPAPPGLEGFDDFEIEELGSQSLDSRSITIINGRKTVTTRYGRAFDYALTPKRTGKLTIPAPKAEIDGRVIRGQTLTLEVIAPEEQDVVKMRIEADRAEVYPLQPFRVALKIWVRAVPEPNDAANPLRVQRTPPDLQVPWVFDEKLPEGVRPRRAWSRWLEPLQQTDGGFRINNINSRTIFSLFDEHFATFLPAGKIVERPDASGERVEYWEFTFAREFVGEQVGTYQFGPATLKGRFAVGRDARGQLEGDDFFVIAPAVEVRVKDVPTAGRPDSYIGATGQFRVRAQLSPTEAKVGDPLTLTLEIAGEGTLDGALPPKIAQLPEVAKHFKVYEPTTESDGAARRFIYQLRPEDARAEAFPAVPISYFDVEAGKYVTLHTDPIPLKIHESQRLSAQEIAVATPQAEGEPAARAREEGIFANVTDLSALRDRSIRPRRWLIGLAALVGLYVAAVVVVGRTRRRQGDSAARRKRDARRAALRWLNAAQVEIDAGRWRAAANHLREAVVGLIADAGGLPHEGLTTADARAELQKLELPAELVARTTRLLDACDAARYGGSEESLQESARDANKLIDQLAAALRARKLVR